MDESSQIPQTSTTNNVVYKLSFRGNGITLFKIWITNLLLTICTLGIYYPWGRANMRKYLYSSTYLGDYSFEFSGTGKQMFFGLLKFLAISIVCMLGLIAIYAFVIPEDILKAWGTLLNLLYFALYSPILALFIHGSCRYRMSKTSYRGIRFGYRGERKTLVLSLFKYGVLTAITFGIYYSWLVNNVRKYIYGNTRFGNIKMEFNGKGGEYCGKLVGGSLLSGITFGIYYFWFKTNLFNYFYGNMSFNLNEQTLKVKAYATAGNYFILLVGNFLITLFTLGLGYPFAKARTMRFICDNVELHGNIDLDKVLQTEDNYSDAIGDAEADLDGSSDFFDLDIF
jgi:uncharacterized membrane protein YjgN (DUF898 family)